jgi:hypothetical protein
MPRPQSPPLRQLLAGIALMAALAFVGCDGNAQSRKGRLDLHLTGNIPASGGMRQVWLEVSGMTLERADGTRYQYGFDNHRRINLSGLQGGRTTALMIRKTLPAGRYKWLQLHLNTKGSQDTYAVFPNGTQREFKLSAEARERLRIEHPFTIQAEGVASLTVDFSLHPPFHEADSTAGTLAMKPTLRPAPTD